jgi:hypothetical protein
MPGIRVATRAASTAAKPDETVAGKLMWMSSSPAVAARAIALEMGAPESPAWTTKCVWIASAYMRDAIGVEPMRVGLPEQPKPGIEGMALWTASSTRPS